MNEVKPRRKSIFGGLLWIAIGSLLLANNLGAKFGFLEFVWNWWPLLLILLGLGKLFEHYAATQAGETPARLLSGGEIFLLIILFLIGGAYAGVVRISGDPNIVDDDFFPWWSPHTFTEEVTKSARANSKIVVTLPRGDITVHPEDSTMIRVVVNKTVRATDESEAQELTRDYGITIEESRDVVEIRAKSTGQLKRRVRLDLELHIPRQSMLDLRTENGALIVNGLTGNLTTNSRGGNLEIRDVIGNVDVEMRGHDIRVSNIKGDVKIGGRGSDIEVTDVTGQATVTGTFTGSTRMKNVAKEARFNSQRTDLTVSALRGSLDLGRGELEVFDASNVSVNTSSYDMVFENITGRVSLDNKNGNIEVRLNAPPREDIDISNEKGDISIMLPAKSEFTIDANSRNGRAESDFKDGVRVSEDNDHGRIEGKVGARGPMIKLRSTHGTLKLRQGTGSSTSTEAPAPKAKKSS